MEETTKKRSRLLRSNPKAADFLHQGEARAPDANRLHLRRAAGVENKNLIFL